MAGGQKRVHCHRLGLYPQNQEGSLKFALVQPSNRYPGLKPCWYRVIDNIEELDEHCRVYLIGYHNTVWKDPHFEAAIQKGDAHAVARHPLNIIPKRNSALHRALARAGRVFINLVGGWMTLNDESLVLEELEADSYPAEPLTGSQYVYIGKWPMARHYYLSAWPKPLAFENEKYNTYEEAFAEARKFVAADRIKSMDVDKQKFIYQKDGD